MQSIFVCVKIYKKSRPTHVCCTWNLPNARTLDVEIEVYDADWQLDIHNNVDTFLGASDSLMNMQHKLKLFVKNNPQ